MSMASRCLSVGGATDGEEAEGETLEEAEGLGLEPDALAEGEAEALVFPEGEAEALVFPEGLGLVPVELLEELLGPNSSMTAGEVPTTTPAAITTTETPAPTINNLDRVEGCFRNF
jgi:hypothetical protein